MANTNEPKPLTDSGGRTQAQHDQEWLERSKHPSVDAQGRTQAQRDQEYSDRQKAYREETGVYYGVRDESGVIRPYADRSQAITVAEHGRKTVYIKDKHSKWEPFDFTGEGTRDNAGSKGE